MSVNPYAAPKAAVADETLILDADYVPGGRSVGVGRGWAWIAEAWGLFRQQTGLWIGMMLLLFVMLFAMGLIPFLGAIAQVLLWPVFVAGIVLGCDAIHRGSPMELTHLFAGFQNRTGTLIGVGGLSLLATAVVLVVVMLAMGASFAALAGREGGLDAAMLLPFLVFLALVLPVVMAIWFAPPLVALRQLGAIEAIKDSFLGCLKNILPFLLYGVVWLGLLLVVTMVGAGILALAVGGSMASGSATAMFGSIALMFAYGLVVSVLFGPLVFGSVYTAYRDIYLMPRGQKGP